MKNNFLAGLHFVLSAEGGYSNDPGDPGGATMHGIEHSEYDRYRKARGEPVRDVRSISDAEVQDIYKKRYWDVCQCDDLPSPVDVAVFNYAVNLGNVWACRLLSRVVCPAGKPEARSVTPEMVKLTTTAPEHVALSLVNQADKYYETIAAEHHALRTFLRGWLNRNNALREKLRQMTSATK